jgi:predicted DCC family thiol-disulfide oxidoreductase YuxK
MPKHIDPSEVSIIYDSECPVCTAYSCSVEVGDNRAKPRLISARSEDSEVSAALAAGLDLDEGMVVLYKGERYHGAEAMHILALAAPAKGLFGHLNRFLFGSRRVAKFLYPAMRAGRNLLLWLLGKKKIAASARAQQNPAPSRTD